jgi:hypothetical protein
MTKVTARSARLNSLFDRVRWPVSGNLGIGHRHPVTAFTLGTIKRGIGGLEQIPFVRPMIWECRHSDGSGNESQGLAIVHDYEVAELRSNTLGAGLGGSQIGGRQNDDEFFAAIPTDEILSANAPHKEGCGFPQNSVTRVVAVGVVEILAEEIDAVLP